jgi:thioredoxin reductase (NADPH)
MELTTLLRDQSVSCGAEILTETVESVDLSVRPFVVRTGDREVQAQTVIVATGAVARRLEVPGAGDGPDGFWNKGVSACAVCDGAAPIFRDVPLVVVGGGDTAMEEAVFLTRYGSHVTVVHRRDTLRASAAMQERAKANGKISFAMDSVVSSCVGGGGPRGNLLGAVKIRNVKTGEETELAARGLFFAVGHDPATKFLSGQLTVDADGYVEVTPGSTRTSVPGVFAAGDVADKKYRQAITAAGTGCMAAIDAEHFLSEQGI